MICAEHHIEGWKEFIPLLYGQFRITFRSVKCSIHQQFLQQKQKKAHRCCNFVMLSITTESHRYLAPTSHKVLGKLVHDGSFVYRSFEVLSMTVPQICTTLFHYFRFDQRIIFFLVSSSSLSIFVIFWMKEGCIPYASGFPSISSGSS